MTSNPKPSPEWPADADGDVFRRLAAHDFDFARPHCVDYNVDFDRWPPAQSAVDLLDASYGPVVLFPPTGRSVGYAQVQVHAALCYDAVMRMQHKLSVAMAPYGGICESWGVMQDDAAGSNC